MRFTFVRSLILVLSLSALPSMAANLSRNYEARLASVCPAFDRYIDEHPVPEVGSPEFIEYDALWNACEGKPSLFKLARHRHRHRQ